MVILEENKSENEKMKYQKYKKYVKMMHGTQKRKQGTPYYEHPIAVSKILREKGFGMTYQICALFHDLLEDTEAIYEDIEEMANSEIADIIILLTKEPGYVMKKYIGRIKKNKIAKMVKLADRIHNLSEIEGTERKFIEKYIDETEKWYIDLARGTVFEEDLKKVLDKAKTV